MKISLIDHFRMLKELIIVTFFMILFFGVIFHNFPPKTIFPLVVIVLLYLVLFLLPVICIHLNYYNYNKYSEYDFSEKGIKIVTAKSEVFFDNSDIKEIKLILSPQKRNNSGIFFLPFLDYYYFEIEMYDGEKIILSCLLKKSLDRYITNLYQQKNINYVI